MHRTQANDSCGGVYIIHIQVIRVKSTKNERYDIITRDEDNIILYTYIYIYFTVTGGVDGVVRSGREGAVYVWSTRVFFAPFYRPPFYPYNWCARAFVCVRSRGGRERRQVGIQPPPRVRRGLYLYTHIKHSQWVYIYLFIISSSGLSCGRLTHRNTQPPAVYIYAQPPPTHTHTHTETYIIYTYYDFVVRRRALLPAARPSRLSRRVHCCSVGVEWRVRSAGSRRYLHSRYILSYIYICSGCIRRGQGESFPRRVFSLRAKSRHGYVCINTKSARPKTPLTRHNPNTAYIYIYSTPAVYNDIIIVYIYIYAYIDKPSSWLSTDFLGAAEPGCIFQTFRVYI